MYANIAPEIQVYVVVLAQEGSFLRAARKLHTSQPFLTRRIAYLEKSIGAKLFDRTSRRLELTAAGNLFVPEAIASLNHAERAWDLARYQGRIESGPLRIGYSPYIHSSLLPVLHHPDFTRMEAPRILLEGTYTTELIRRVLHGDLHVGLGILPITDSDLWVKPIAQEPLYLCIPKNHSLAQKATVNAKDMHGEMVFWVPKRMHTELYERTTEYIESMGAMPIYYEVCSTAQAIEIVGHGFGLALVQKSAARLSRTGVVFKPLTDRLLQIETALFTRKNLRRSLGPLIDLLLEKIQALKLQIQ